MAKVTALSLGKGGQPVSGALVQGDTLVHAYSGALKGRSLMEGSDEDGELKIGDLVVHRDEPSVIYKILMIRWACPPEKGGMADLKFWGAHPRIGGTATWHELNRRDLENDVFGAYLKDLSPPPNEMEAVAISAI